MNFSSRTPYLLRISHLLPRSGRVTIRRDEPSGRVRIFTLVSSLVFLSLAVTTKALGIPEKQQVDSWMHFLSRTALVSPLTTGRASALSGLTKERNSLLLTVPSPLTSKASMSLLNCSFSILSPSCCRTLFISAWLSSMRSRASSLVSLSSVRSSLEANLLKAWSQSSGSRSLTACSHLYNFLRQLLSKIFLKFSPGRRSLRKVSRIPEYAAEWMSQHLGGK
mmetsp:Transcript_5303/g.9645  ORF Transcript_5303/g.9645 Transcript_5303/m.9645 type:complete len:222 (-) Transcript_5303:1786-2451(-)